MDELSRLRTYPINKVIVNLHLFAKLTPDLLQCQLIVRVDEAIQPNHVKVAFMLL
jgi:hypothetical protein